MSHLIRTAIAAEGFYEKPKPDPVQYLVTITFRRIRNHLISQTYSFDSIEAVNRCCGTWRTVSYVQAISVVQVMENTNDVGRKEPLPTESCDQDTVRRGGGGLEVEHFPHRKDRDRVDQTSDDGDVHPRVLSNALRHLARGFVSKSSPLDLLERFTRMGGED